MKLYETLKFQLKRNFNLISKWQLRTVFTFCKGSYDLVPRPTLGNHGCSMPLHSYRIFSTFLLLRQGSCHSDGSAPCRTSRDIWPRSVILKNNHSFSTNALSRNKGSYVSINQEKWWSKIASRKSKRTHHSSTSKIFKSTVTIHFSYKLYVHLPFSSWLKSLETDGVKRAGKFHYA